MTDEDLARLLTSASFRYQNERELQDAIEALLLAKQVSYEREVVLSPKDRIDFLVGAIGVEVKIDSSLPVVQRQLWRYAEDPRIASLILVTSRAKHKQLPTAILGKPVLVVHLFASIF